MNKVKIIFLLVWAACLFNLNSTFAVSSNVLGTNSAAQVAVGTFIYHDNIEQPMLITNVKNGSWSFIKTILDTENGAYLYNVHCTNKTCIATGSLELQRYYWPTHHRYPLFILSKDQGRTWFPIEEISGLPNMTDGIAPYISCTDSHCTAVGFYKSYEGPTFPLLLVSGDGGESWAYMQNIIHSPATMKNASLGAITCTGNTCLAAGTYLSGPHYDPNWTPYVLISRDGGTTWSFVSNITGLPRMKPATLTSIRCNNNFCVIAGTYDYKHALLLVSEDKGQSWSFVKEMPDTSDIKDLTIEDLTYTNGAFIAVGGYRKDKGFLQSLILVSSENAQSWSIVKEISGSQFKKLGWLKSISCSSNTCIAGGDEFYVGGANFGLTLLVSENNGKTWSLIPHVAGTAYTPDINLVHCSDNHCVAMGNASDNIDYSHPVLLVSDDYGKSWVAVKDIHDFPQDIYKIHFSSVTNSRLKV